MATTSIRIGSDDKTYGTLSVQNGKLKADGPRADTIYDLAAHYSDMMDKMGKEMDTPEQLLDFMLERMQGLQWAVPADWKPPAVDTPDKSNPHSAR